MYLESLPNETLLKIFIYLPTECLYHAFRDLNSRFDKLLMENLTWRGVDFRFLSRKDIRRLFHRYLKPVVHQSVAISLGETDLTTSGNATVICQCFKLLHLQGLQSLTIEHLPLTTFNCFVNEISLLKNLRELKIHFTRCFLSVNNLDRLIDKIWDLKNLKVLYLEIKDDQLVDFVPPMNISSSIRSLSLISMKVKFATASHILMMTPNLQHLHVDLYGYFEQPVLNFEKTAIKDLHVSFDDDLDANSSFFASMPKLTTLTVETKAVNLDGIYWRLVITNNFPNLTNFRFKMDRTSSYESFSLDCINALMGTFKTDFWLTTLKCNFQCDWYNEGRITRFVLYSIPYPSDTYKFQMGNSILSTIQTQDYVNRSQVHRKVENLSYKYRLTNQLVRCSIVFPFVKSLTIYLPCDPIILKLVENWDSLISMNITIGTNLDDAQFDLLLSKATFLQKILVNFQVYNEQVFKKDTVISRSLRDVELYSNLHHKPYSYETESFWRSFSQSTIGRNCQSLTVSLNKATDFIKILGLLPNLQKFTIRTISRFGQDYKRLISEAENDLKPIFDNGWVLNDDRSNPNIVLMRTDELL